LLLDSATQPAWICRLIETLGEKIVAIEVRESPRRTPSLLERNVLERIDAAKFAKPDDALAPCEVPPVFGSIAGADIILDFTDREGGAPARANVWTLHHDAVADFLAQRPITTAELRANGIAIARVHARTDPISLHRGLSRLGWKSAAMIARAIEGSPASSDLDAGMQADRTPGIASSLIATARMRLSIAASARSVRRYVSQQIIDRFMHEQWLVGVRFGERGRFLPITPPDDRLWADPFVVIEDRRVFVFVEELVYREGRGTIAVMEVRRDGTATPPRRILERPHLLSYPCVFRWNGHHYMLPETGENATVELYRCRSFPDEWEPAAVLMRGIHATDATMFEHAGGWWMYLSTAPDGETFDELSLFHAGSPLGPWLAHPRNPILSSVVGGRCAGRPFLRDGRLLRPAQIGARRYGHSIQLREIVTLTADAYVEREDETILPDWTSGLAGAHTYNVAGDVTVIDGVRYRWGS
jgi:hypothetical protein